MIPKTIQYINEIILSFPCQNIKQIRTVKSVYACTLIKYPMSSSSVAIIYEGGLGGFAGNVYFIMYVPSLL